MLIEASDTIRADDTCVAGWIRILSLDCYILVQEQTPAAYAAGLTKAFIEHRLASYERMWDGCGCTIDYQHQPADS